MDDQTNLPEIESVDPLELLAQLRASLHSNFVAAKVLIDMVEHLATEMSASDRIAVSRLTYAVAHAIDVAARKGRAA